MKNNLDIVDQLHDVLKTLMPLKPEDRNRLDRKFRLEFNYNSNHIEGNTLTYGETELLLLFDDTRGNHSMREYEEIKAHDVAYQMIEELAKDKERPLTEQIIKNLNEIILVRPYWKDAITLDGQNTRRQIKVGDYKEFPNSVRLRNGEIFEYTSPTDTPHQMQELISWFRSEENAVHPVTLATMLHYKFVRVHPFDDGNGRIARLLMNYVLLKNNFPPVVIKSEDKDNYLRALHIADVGDYSELINYVALQEIWSLELSIKAAKGEGLEEDGDFKKEIELIKRKTSSKGVPRSPRIIYETFTSVNKSVWETMLITLEYFDTLFNEVENRHGVNNRDEVVENKGFTGLNSEFFAALSVFNSQPAQKDVKIFGHQVYGASINNIAWKHIMYGLRGANKIIDVNVSLKISFDSFHYEINLQVDNNVVHKSERRYKDSFLPGDTEKINDALKRYLLDFINKETD